MIIIEGSLKKVTLTFDQHGHCIFLEARRLLRQKFNAYYAVIEHYNETITFYNRTMMLNNKEKIDQLFLKNSDHFF